jgi:hypothetical protein
MRTAADERELPVESYEYFADRDPLTRAVMDRIIGYRDLATLVIAIERHTLHNAPNDQLPQEAAGTRYRLTVNPKIAVEVPRRSGHPQYIGGAPVKLHTRTKALAISIALCGLVVVAWAGISAASNSASTGQTHSTLTVDPTSIFVEEATVSTFDSTKKYDVAPGDSVSGTAYCPTHVQKHGMKLITWKVVGGGYVIGGDVGASIASATASYPTSDSNGYRVVVSNPKLASDTVSFLVRASCLEVWESPLGE